MLWRDTNTRSQHRGEKMLPSIPSSPSAKESCALPLKTDNRSPTQNPSVTAKPSFSDITSDESHQYITLMTDPS